MAAAELGGGGRKEMNQQLNRVEKNQGEAQMDGALSNFDKHMTAVAFAEAGEHETAKKILEGKSAHAPLKEPHRKKKPIGATLLFGAMSLGAYFYLFSHEEWTTTYFVKGGWYTVLPIATAVFFSFIHGAFGSNLLSVLGLEAKK
jgi:hypothetical protein